MPGALARRAPATPLERALGAAVTILLRILRDALAQRRLFGLAVLAQLAQIGLSLALPLVIKEAIDRGLAARDLGVLVLAAAITIGLTLVRGAAWYAVVYLYQALSSAVGFDIRRRVYDKIQRSSFSFLTRSQSGDLFAHGSMDVSSVEEFLNGGVRELINLTILTTMLAVALVGLDFGLTALIAPVVPLVVVLALFYAPRARERSRRRQHIYGQLTARLQENLTGMRVVKAFAAEEREKARFAEMNDALFAGAMRITTLNSYIFPTMTLVTNIGIAVALWSGGQRVIAGEMSLGSLVAFVAYLTMIVAPIRSLGVVINMITEAIAGAERSYHMIDSRAVIETPDQAAVRPEMPEIRGGVEFRDVSFGYRPGGRHYVLRDVDLAVEPGQTLGVVGLTGAGKTSLVHLIGHYYDPAHGAVLVDGRDVREVRAESLRRQIGYVFQDPFLYSASIADNIAFGRPDASREDVIRAARDARLHDFVVSLPEGYETELGERGITLSGGQRQRLALARALLIDPRILILDDTTSALDPVTATEVWRNVTKRRGGLTTIVIAQRLTAVRGADRIVVLEGGRVVERGRHDELVAAGGLYAHLWHQQEEQAGDVADQESLRADGHADGQADGRTRAPVEEAPPPQPVATEGAAKKDVLALSEDDKVEGKAYDHSMMLRMSGYLTPFRALVGLTVAVMLVSSAASLASPYIQQMTIDRAIGAGDPLGVRYYAFVLMVAGVVQWTFGMAHNYFLGKAAWEMLRAVRTHIFDHLQSLSLTFYDRYKVGRLMSIMTGDVGAIANLLSSGLVAMVADLFVLIGVVVALLTLDVRLALLSFLSAPIVGIASHKLSQRTRASYREVRRWSSTANGALAEGIAGARVTQAYVREERNLARYTELIGRFRDATRRAARDSALFGPTMDAIGSFVTALVLVYGGALAIDGELTTGAIVAFLAYTQRFFEPIRDLSSRYNSIQAAMAGAERIFALLDTPPTIVNAPGARALPPVKGEVRLDHVNFAYVPGRLVLRDIDLDVKPGEQIAIVGPTGSGKTSIVSLICRFYDVTEGEIRVDGHPIRSVGMESLRRQIGLVLQDPFLFSGSYNENMRFARPNATQAEIEEACRAVGIHDFIVEQPLGYSTALSERGANLSAGQRQLLSFARALLANPRILILDEATANVDTQTEAEIQKALKVLLTGRTAFIVAHRLSTIRSADRIVVLQDGRIAEVGAHDDLVRADGSYARLHRAHAAV